MQKNIISKSLSKDIPTLVKSVRNSSEFQESILRFNKQESKSLMEPSAQAFIYELVKKLGVRSALEIGTYFAGGTKVIAEAMQGNGVLMTIDSNKGRMNHVISEIDSWPKLLKDITIYVDSTSSSFFNVSKYKEMWFDFCFIDGEHSYTTALIDLINCARFSGPEAVILLDDAVQPAVFNAARDFLLLHPNWHEIGGVIKPGESNIGHTSGSFPGLPFLILAGPSFPSIDGERYSFHSIVDSNVSGIKIDLAVPATEGCLEARFLLTRCNDHHLEDVNSLLVKDSVKKVENGDTTINLILEESYNSSQNLLNKIDAHLFWKGVTPQSNLALSNPPSVIHSYN